MTKSPASRGNVEEDVDPLDTSVGLLLGFLGAMIATTVALATGTTAAEWPWFSVIATITAITSRTTGTLGAAYNGLVGALFFNFMRPPARRLSFDSIPSVIFEAGFIAIAIVANYVWRHRRALSAARALHVATPEMQEPRKRSPDSLYLTPRQRERLRHHWPDRWDTD